MALFYLIMYILALVCFLLATFGNIPRINVMALGLAFFVVPAIVQTAMSMP